jgi:hypothetical protein
MTEYVYDHTFYIRPRTRWHADGPPAADEQPTVVVTGDTNWGFPMIGVTFTERSGDPWYMSRSEAADLITAIQQVIDAYPEEDE